MNNFKIGDKVKCIETEYFVKIPLTLNKIYEVIKREVWVYNCIFIKNDDGYIDYYNECRFIKVDCLKYKIRKLKVLLKK